jgi:alkylated DNA repair dioxygenase AlkB
MYEGFDARSLMGGGVIWTGALPEALRVDEAGFEALWALHPEVFHTIHIHGRRVQTPRWQQAYGHDYRYTGNTNAALPVDPLMEPLLAWFQTAIDARLNGLLFNWYDGAQRHYIGAHRDSTIGLTPDTPIVTLSLGQARPWRLRPWKGAGFEDLDATDGSVFILPWATNQTHTHEVTAPSAATGRRISITARAFTTE